MSGTTSEAWLAVLLPFCVFLLARQMLGKPPISFNTVLGIIKGRGRVDPARYGHFSLERAAYSYDTYLHMSLEELDAMRKSYGKLSRIHKRIGYELGYPSKLDKLEQVTHANALITTAIARFATEQYTPQLNSHQTGDLHRVREALRHFVRDWSTEGASERHRIFQPILTVLDQVPVAQRKDMKVLVPGSGLGRLAWEISKLDFDTTAIELSHFMTLALRFLLATSTTHTPGQHCTYPYASWFSHQRSSDNTFRAVSFPDELPRLCDRFHLKEGDFLKHFPKANNSSSSRSPGYDFIVTLFFIDTSLNLIETISHIHSLLRPGGQWINLGPLLWTSGAQARLELSLEEVLSLVSASGFRLEEGSPETERRTVICEYTADQHAMMQWLYHAEFWVATKVQGDLVPEMD